MRRRIAKRKRKNVLRMGGQIIRECWIKEPDWPRKSCGYGVVVKYNGWTIHGCGRDELEAYQGVLFAMEPESFDIGGED